MNIYDIESNYGKLIIGNRHSKPTLGLQAFAAYFYEVSECVYVTNEKEFYIYNSKSGLWERQTQEVLISRISEVMLDLAQTVTFPAKQVNLIAATCSGSGFDFTSRMR